MYHSISDTPETGVPGYYQVRTRPSVFAEHMGWLKANGYEGISLEAAIGYLRRGSPERTKPVVITFDDGFQDVLTDALPVLRRHGFGATVFLPTAYVGESRQHFKGTPCLTWDEVRQLRRSGIRFGSHTVNHPLLYECAWPEIEAELRQSKAAIEARLGEPVETFAYPYAYPQADARFVNRFTSALKSAGYTCCVTTAIGRVSAGDDPFCLKRLPLNGADDLALLAAKLAGAYDWLAWPQRTAKSLKTLRHRWRTPKPSPA